MKLNRFIKLYILLLLISVQHVFAQSLKVNSYLTTPQEIPQVAKPWVFWYWMHASVSKEGIIADLQAMKQQGIAGAYIAPIKGKTNPPLYEPAIETLTPQWWDIFKFTVAEADKLGLQIALLPNDGFATAGGPWITPALSMQKVVWTSKEINGGKWFKDILTRPEAYDGYYKDIAVLAFPTPGKQNYTTQNIVPKITTSTGDDASFLVKQGNTKNFGSKDPCWIQYEFVQPFLCRSVKISVDYYNFQSERLLIEVSNDGKNFKSIGRLKPPRVGWLDWDAPETHAIIPTTAKYFRFVYNPEGTEPGAEDIDAAKWKPSLKIRGLELSSAPQINQFEGKSGMVWRVSQNTSIEELPQNLCIPLNEIINITDKLDSKGKLNWRAPKGNWTILRIGHTSTGHQNETAGRGKGLEVDKFNAKAVSMQFDKWYGEAVKQVGPELAKDVLKVFHVDSWECGSQNWSPVFAAEFNKRRGYDLTKYLPAMAGFGVGNAQISEQFLYDVRKTIAELLNANFFETLRDLAHSKGAIFTAETTAPVMVGDGLKHFGTVDVPMGEFWLKSPTHDKPNDILDAISGAHIYGKNIVQAEAFTTIRMEWNEHPGNIKTLQDRNYALGINKLVYHVYVHNPWMDRKPGMTLDGIGLYFQRDQTWWKPGKAWVDYAQRCQTLLQQGKPVSDIAIFAGEEIPTRALLPDRLVSTLPGIFGKERLASEKLRMENKNQPLQKIAGVTSSANMAQPEDWVNPLHGYSYDSFNGDVLANARVENGKVVFASGATYAILVLPQKHQLNPNNIISLASLRKLIMLVKAGAKVVIGEKPLSSASLSENASAYKQSADSLYNGTFDKHNIGNKFYEVKEMGKGLVIKGPYQLSDFGILGLEKDFIAEENGNYAEYLAYNHRTSEDGDIYFIANQQAKEREISVSLRASGKLPEIYNAVTGERMDAQQYEIKDGRTNLSLQFAPNASLFILLKKDSKFASVNNGTNYIQTNAIKTISNTWKLNFDPAFGGPKEPVVFNRLSDWSTNKDSTIKYYSGTVNYHNSFEWQGKKAEALWLDLGEVANLAIVKVNGIMCGTAWTPPYRVDISKAVKAGKNNLEIEVSNTWANRIIGDEKLPEEKRITQTTAPFRIGGNPLEKSGLLGPVVILEKK